jgi:hypothetical protein
MARFSLLAAVLLALGSWGCVSKPTVHLNHAELNGVQLSTFPPSMGVVMTVLLDVYNPNGYDVAVRAVRGQTVFANKYTLPIDYRAPADGLWLPSDRTTSVPVPINMPLPLAIMLVREAFGTPTIAYRFTGSADVTATRTFQLEKDNYAVDEVGTLTRQQMEAVIPAPFLAQPAPTPMYPPR